MWLAEIYSNKDNGHQQLPLHLKKKNFYVV